MIKKILKFVLTILLFYALKLAFCHDFWELESVVGIWLMIIIGSGLIVTVITDIPESKYE